MKWRRIFLLPLVRCLETDNMVNGATGAINDTAPTVAQGEINVHSIEVGKREHLFTPNSINALPGDIVTFKFWPGSHSVIRASYGRPCEPYENIQGNEGQGFYSGTMTPDDVDVGQGTLPTWNLTINTTYPTFFYCGAPGSCINWAMVGAINADAEHSIVSQIQSARKAKYVLLPGDSIPHDASPSVQSTRTDSSITGATTSQPPSSRASTTSADEQLVSPKSAENMNQHSQASISAGAIAGIVIGVVALAVFATGFFCIAGRRRKSSDHPQRSSSHKHRSSPHHSRYTQPIGEDSKDSAAHMTSANVLPPYALHPSLRPIYPGAKPPSEADGVPITGDQLSPRIASPETTQLMSFESANLDHRSLHSRRSRESTLASPTSDLYPRPLQTLHELPSSSP